MEPARRIEDLVAWQRASELSDLCDEMVRQPRPSRNRRFCEQLAASSDSVSANLAEGFGRYYPRENAYFVRVAKASLAETQDALLKGRRRKYWPPADFERAWRLSCRTMKAVANYLRYLESCDGEIPGKPQPPDPPPEEP